MRDHLVNYKHFVTKKLNDGQLSVVSTMDCKGDLPLKNYS